MMNSQFNEQELVKLYEKFQELDREKKGALTNAEFLELPEFKYCPFRRRLLYALQLKTDEEVKETVKLVEEPGRLDELGQRSGEDSGAEGSSDQASKDSEDEDKKEQVHDAAEQGANPESD